MKIKKMLKISLITFLSIFVLFTIFISFRLIQISYDFNNDRPTHEMYFEGVIKGKYIDILDATYWVTFYDIDGNQTRHEKLEINIFKKFYMIFNNEEVYVEVVAIPNSEQSAGSDKMLNRFIAPHILNIYDIKKQKIKFILNVYYTDAIDFY